MHFYITGDTHRSFDRIEDFCYGYETTIEDVMIILGDAGINYWLDLSDKELKGQLSGMNITFFCIHGNHEARPWEAADYEEKIWNEGIVYVEEQYPNILFAKDGEVYNFNGKKVMPIGGAYSIDKYYRIRNGLPWFETEQPDEAIKEYVEQQLDKAYSRIQYRLKRNLCGRLFQGLINQQWISQRKNGYRRFMTG